MFSLHVDCLSKMSHNSSASDPADTAKLHTKSHLIRSIAKPASRDETAVNQQSHFRQPSVYIQLPKSQRRTSEKSETAVGCCRNVATEILRVKIVIDSSTRVISRRTQASYLYTRSSEHESTCARVYILCMCNLSRAG